MTAADTLAGKVRRATSASDHAQRLINALGDPSAYEYRGECFDAGPGAADSLNGPKCACSHPIRFVFYIYHRVTGDQKQLGSTCVERFAEYSPETGARMLADSERLQAQLAEALKAAKRAAADAENTALWARYVEVRDRAINTHRTNRACGRWSPSLVFSFAECSHRFKRAKPPTYKTPAPLRRWLNDAITFIETRVLAS